MFSTKTAYRCDVHGINTCPLTPSALTYSDGPCCDQATPLVTLHSDGSAGTDPVPVPGSWYA